MSKKEDGRYSMDEDVIADREYIRQTVSANLAESGRDCVIATDDIYDIPPEHQGEYFKVQAEVAMANAKRYGRKEECMTKIDENTSDGFHTFKELYEVRLLLTASLFNEWAESAEDNKPWVFKSRLHSDGTIPFNDLNWFIVVAETREGQISFHYEVKDWDLFHTVPEVTLAPKYDGHTASDVAVRLRKLLSA